MPRPMSPLIRSTHSCLEASSTRVKLYMLPATYHLPLTIRARTYPSPPRRAEAFERSSLSTMNFAPYQDVDPERERALSPPPSDGRRSKSPLARDSPSRSSASPPSLPNPNAFRDESAAAGHHVGLGDRGVHLDAFETSLPLRLDYEAMLAYLLLPPAGPVLLLMVEHKSDYVRYGMTGLSFGLIHADTSHSFHAWQSSMLFTVIFV